MNDKLDVIINVDSESVIVKFDRPILMFTMPHYDAREFATAILMKLADAKPISNFDKWHEYFNCKPTIEYTMAVKQLAWLLSEPDLGDNLTEAFCVLKPIINTQLLSALMDVVELARDKFKHDIAAALTDAMGNNLSISGLQPLEIYEFLKWCTYLPSTPKPL